MNKKIKYKIVKKVADFNNNHYYSLIKLTYNDKEWLDKRLLDEETLYSTHDKKWLIKKAQQIIRITT
jgi:hypothetical protein